MTSTGPYPEDLCCVCQEDLILDGLEPCRRCDLPVHITGTCCADYDVDEDAAGHQRSLVLCVNCAKSPRGTLFP